MHLETARGHDYIDHRPGSQWWRGAVGYEIYIRSFFDTNADGVGDLDGITAKLDYLEALGIDVIWITPFFPSPDADHGYDVSDYVDVDPQFGTLEDFDELIAAAHQRGLRVFVDIVPNHSSSRHPWFQAAITDITSPYRGYYHFRPAAPDGGPPNNWVSHFGGSAWTLDPAGTGEYYLHLFLPEQPDLNWANPAVMDEFRKILVFWCERGVDGFRVDVAHGLTKDPLYRDNPQLRPITPDMHPSDVFGSFHHVHDLHREATRDIYREWREVVDSYGAVLLGELDTRDVHRFGEYVANGDALDVGFVLKLGHVLWQPATILSDLFTYARAAKGGSAWPLSNHDVPRAVSRFGDGERGLRRVTAVTTLAICLDGITFLYQGEELGLPDAQLVGRAHDPITTRNRGVAGRDVARGPMPWDSSHLNGFSTAKKAWIDTAPIPPEMTAAAQTQHEGSTWHRYHDMVTLRRRYPSLWQAELEIVVRDDTVAVLDRDDLTIVANLGAEPYEYVPAGRFSIVFESALDAAEIIDGRLAVAAEATVIVRRTD